MSYADTPASCRPEERAFDLSDGSPPARTAGSAGSAAERWRRRCRLLPLPEPSGATIAGGERADRLRGHDPWHRSSLRVRPAGCDRDSWPPCASAVARPGSGGSGAAWALPWPRVPRARAG